ncbi:MAG: tetratricopeptide repeat protein, partial [Gemmatimonadales bacterium]
DIHTLEAQVAESPDEPARRRALGEALIEAGEGERGLEELDKALVAAENQEDWGLSEDLVEEILRLDPNSVRHHQKRVELAYRSNDRGRMVEYYLALADALLRQGSMDRSRNVYQRVLELDPENDAAQAALSTFGPAEEEAAEPVGATAPVEGEGGEAGGAGEAGGDFVDLGALILGDEEPAVKDTRMRVEEEEPTGDEDRDFAEMLAEFKKGIAANVEEEDWQAHYDLGIAFKEMGLLDEAIAELQKALRSSEGRLKSSEALGMCFYEKGQYAVAATVLKRAIDGDPRGDDAKIGLLYWLGRCEEEQGKSGAALDYYQRVFAVDIGFQDVSDRVKSLAEAES